MITWIKRKIHSKGFHIPSPFAYKLITNVIYERCKYNAFEDIHLTLLKNKIDTKLISQNNYLSFRIVNHIKPKKILEINPPNIINPLFTIAPSKQNHCFCLQSKEYNFPNTEKITQEFNRISFIKEENLEKSYYDAIFIHLNNNKKVSIKYLHTLSHNKSFWVIFGINTNSGKLFWKELIKDQRVRISMDKTSVGIVFLESHYTKKNYLI